MRMWIGRREGVWGLYNVCGMVYLKLGRLNIIGEIGVEKRKIGKGRCLKIRLMYSLKGLVMEWVKEEREEFERVRMKGLRGWCGEGR